MSKESAPAFQFYPRDFLTDERVRMMSHRERGIYITLLCLCWTEQSLPADLTALAKLVNVPAKPFIRLWENSVLKGCFAIVNDRLRHKRLDAEREKQAQHHQIKSDSGKAGAEARWQGHSGANGSAIDVPMAKHSSSSATASATASSSSSSEKHKKQKPDFQGQKFDLFPWQRVKLERIFTGAYEWAIAFDKRIADNGQTVPQDREAFWQWLLKQAEAEAKRRGATVADTTARRAWSLDVCRERGHGGIHGSQSRCDLEFQLAEAKKAQAGA